MKSISRSIGRLLHMDFDYVLFGGSWMMLDHVINVVTSIATTVVLTNVIPKEVYGSYAYLIGIFMLLLPFTLSGVSNAMIRSIARGYEGTFLKGTKTRMAGGFIVTFVLAGVSYYLYRVGRPDQAWATAFASIFYSFAFSADDYKVYYQARKEFSRYALADSLVNITVCFSIIGAALGVGTLTAILGANLISRGVANIVAFFFVYRHRVNDEIDEEFGTYGRNLSVIAIINNISFTIDQVLVGSLYTMEIMASYGLATRLSEPFRILGMLINRLAWPKAVQMEKTEAAEKFFSKLIYLIAVLALSFAAVIVLFPLVIRWLFPLYVDAISLTNFMILSSLLSVLVTYLETYYISQDHLQKFYYAASTVRPVLTIILMFPFIHWWGFFGAVYARLIVRFGSSVVLIFRMIPERRRKTGGV